MKKVNRYTSNEFHDWQRKNLPGRFVIQDLDTWAIIISDSKDGYNPLFIVELKRSYIHPQRWSPFLQDLPNYAALHKLAVRSKLPLVVVYFQKDRVIEDDSEFAIFKIAKVDVDNSKIYFDKKILTAREFIKRFPNIVH